MFILSFRIFRNRKSKPFRRSSKSVPIIRVAAPKTANGSMHNDLCDKATPRDFHAIHRAKSSFQFSLGDIEVSPPLIDVSLLYGRRADVAVAASDSPAPVPFHGLHPAHRNGRENTSGAAHHSHRSRQERLRREHPAVARRGGAAAASAVGWRGLVGVAAAVAGPAL